MSKTERLNTRITPEPKARLRAYSAMQDRPESRIVNAALDRYLPRIKRATAQDPPKAAKSND